MYQYLLSNNFYCFYIFINFQQKNRRSVVFKKQNYHSVYEYPKETVTLSPALSEPQMWQKFSACSPFSGDSSDANKLESNGIEGFAISSSTRPFHSSQFNAQCHTWPTDSDFSWSQVQVDLNYFFYFRVLSLIKIFFRLLFKQNDGQIIANEKFPSYLGLPVEWPKKLEEFYIPKNENSEDIEFHRPDSGVGESVSNAPLNSNKVVQITLIHFHFFHILFLFLFLGRTTF